MKKKKTEKSGDFSAVDQIEAYLKANQSDHYNFEERIHGF